VTTTDGDPRKPAYTREAWLITLSAVLTAFLACLLNFLVGS
jgi:hypothetical protein